jgi:SHS2 domain-containing protein
VAEKLYSLIEHTADIGIRVKGRDIREIFRKTAQAAFSIIAHQEKSKQPGKMSFNIELKAGNLEELLVDWLNELISLSSAKEIIFSDFKLVKITERNLQAVVCGSSTANYRIKTEIKAATYHALKLKKMQRGYEAEVIFDV